MKIFKNHGHGIVEVMTILLLLVLVSTVIVFAQKPGEKMQEYQDRQTQEDVRNIFEDILGMNTSDPQKLAGILSQVAVGRSMIGRVEDCAGDFGVQCSDEQIRDHCLQIQDLGIPTNIHANFTEERKGYYLELIQGELIVGACAPQIRESIELKANLY